jgi:plastocyanin
MKTTLGLLITAGISARLRPTRLRGTGHGPALVARGRSAVLLLALLGAGLADATYGQPATPPPMAVDAHAVTGSSSNVNGVLEPGETVEVDPSWTNPSASAQAVTGTASSLTGLAGPVYTINDGSADYGTVAPGATADCHGATGDCYLVTVTGARPAAHWDAVFAENVSADSTGRYWTLHVGNSFSDVPISDPFYSFIETIFHNGITAGCNAPGNPPAFCTNDSVTRAQMAVFLLKGRLGSGHVPPPATGTVFGDVHIGDFAADWIEELASLGITSGCGNGNYCPSEPATRAQMAVFLLKSEHESAYAPPACTGLFADVPCPSTADFPYSDWIEQLSIEGITRGCSAAPPDGLPGYCPDRPVARAEMAVFLVKTFGLVLYGPPRTPQVLTVTWAHHANCPPGGVNWYFSPGVIRIHAGDTVNWVWVGGFFTGLHSTTSGHPNAPDGTWDSGVHNFPFTFSHTFVQAGTFPYYCSHGHVRYQLICGPLCRCVAGPVTDETGTVIVDP